LHYAALASSFAGIATISMKKRGSQRSKSPSRAARDAVSAVRHSRDSTPPLVRREERLIKRIQGSSKPIVWINGMAGAGKTRLLKALRAVSSGRDPMRTVVLDDPDRQSLESVMPAVGRQRVIVASRSTGPAAVVLRKPRMYGDVEVIEDDALFVSSQDLGSTADPSFALTGGWPVLVDAFASARTDVTLQELPTFLQQEVLPTLSRNLVVALFVALAEPLGAAAVRELFGAKPPSCPLLQQGAQGWIHTGIWVASALKELLRTPAFLGRPLLERIADIHARHGCPARTIPALLEMGQQTQALAVFERSGGPFFGYLWGFPALQAILDGFGREWEDRHESLRLARVWYLLKQGRPREALARLEAHYPGLPVDLRHLSSSCQPYALLARLSLSEDIEESPPREVVMSWSRLEAVLPASDFLARGVVYNTMALAFLRSGQLLQARRLSHEALEAYERAHSPYLAHFMLVHLADIALRQSRLRDAAGYLQRASELLAASGLTFNTEPLVIAFFKARLAYEEGRFEDCPAEIEPTLQALLQGDSWPGLILTIAAHIAFAVFWREGLRAALNTVEQCILTLGRRHSASPDRGLAIMRVRLYQIARRHAEATARLEELDLEPVQQHTAQDDVEEQLVRLRCAIGQPRAAAVAEAAIARTLQTLMQRPTLETRQRVSLGILRAALHHRVGELALARKQLLRALRAAEAENLLGVLVEEGEFLERLLPVIIADHGRGNERLAVFAKRLIQVLRNLPAMALHSKESAGVSRQEHRVLAYLADGYTNKEIARALVLSESGVKFHLRNLFRKLRVASRGALAEAARRHGIAT
jgi:DNA-binding CsgD family transcriptional regulator